MSAKDESITAAVVSLLWFFVLLFVTFGTNACTQRVIHQDAVDKGHAEWETDQKDGTTKFKWKGTP